MSAGALTWTLGVANGVLAVAAVNAVYLTMAGPGSSWLPGWVTTPYGAFTAWRASRFLSTVLKGSPNYAVPPAEAFALLALSTVAYGIYVAVRLGTRTTLVSVLSATGPYVLFAIPVGCFGAFIAVGLMLLDLGIIHILRRPAR